MFSYSFCSYGQLDSNDTLTIAGWHQRYLLWGRHSTAFLLLTQQPQVRFSAIPQKLSKLLVRGKWTEVWKCWSNTLVLASSKLVLQKNDIIKMEWKNIGFSLRWSLLLWRNAIVPLRLKPCQTRDRVLTWLAVSLMLMRSLVSVIH